jgi:anti-sigma factor RsiW
MRAPRLRPAATEAASHQLRRQRRQSSRPQEPQLEHSGAFVLGVALVAGGVMAGLLLGGWLGLGVGAVVVLGGYYFLGVGLGGKHAWLEVFQEFFNL